MNADKDKILELVNSYQNAIHTQKREDFQPLWTDGDNNVLISIATQYTGLENIYTEFLINGIQKITLSSILLQKILGIRFINGDIAVVVFQYHTECIRQETGEPHGISGIETQIVQKVNDKWKIVHIHYSKK